MREILLIHTAMEEEDLSHTYIHTYLRNPSSIVRLKFETVQNLSQMQSAASKACQQLVQHVSGWKKQIQTRLTPRVPRFQQLVKHVSSW
jgi:hypothetical protein